MTEHAFKKVERSKMWWGSLGSVEVGMATTAERYNQVKSNPTVHKNGRFLHEWLQDAASATKKNP